MRRIGDARWSAVQERAGYENAGRGIGVLDHVTRRGSRASGEVALHVLEVMTALLASAREGRRLDLTTTAERPPLVPFTPYEEWSRLVP